MEMCKTEHMSGQNIEAEALSRTNSVRVAANINTPKIAFHSRLGLSGQNLAGSGALVFEGELLEIA